MTFTITRMTRSGVSAPPSLSLLSRARGGAAASFSARSRSRSADPSGDFSPNWPIIDYTADFHVFGVEINDTAMRFYSENASNTVFTIAAPTLCVDNPDFVWGKSMYLPFSPLYGILEVAVNAQRTTNVSWWLHNTAKTYVDWVRFWQFEPSEVPIEA